MSVKSVARRAMARLKLHLSKRWRYACACGCNGIMVSASKNIAERSSMPDSIEEVWVIHNAEKVVADTYSREDGEYVLHRLEGKL